MKLNLLRISLLSLALMLLLLRAGYATHLRAGEITVERVSCNSLTFKITVTVFTNTENTSVLFGGEDDWLDFGDGERVLVPTTPNTLRPDLGQGIATASYTIFHTYPGFQRYLISYSEPNRNEGVLNMDGSVNTRFYIETEIIVDPFLGCNNTPKLLVPPIDRACTGVAWFHNPGAYDPDPKDSLSYEMVIPFREKNTSVINYRDPNHASFYNNFNAGNETASGPPTFKINAIDGTITWDAPGQKVGEYNIAFIVREWRKVRGKWYSVGYVRRDMQIIVDECKNERPDLIIPKDTCVEAGTTLEAIIKGIDPDNDPVKIEAFSEIFQFAPSQYPATYTPVPKVDDFRPQPAETKFKWETQCFHVRERPYQVVFKVTDKSPTGSRLVTFKTWLIKVVGPAPKWVSAQLNSNKESATLNWQNYSCAQNAQTMQVWRRVDKTTFDPDDCDTGMPEFLGYSMIKEVPITTTSFVDTNNGKGLAAGATYCYRLVAIFPLPGGGESYVSEEVCIDPIPIDEPIITAVTINKTDVTNGKIKVKWIRPLELPLTGTDYLEYEVYRADGYEGNAGIIKVSPGKIPDNLATTVYEFPDEGMNTRDRVYNYRIVLYKNSAPIDTSSVASSVRLEAKSEVGKIVLNWRAVVPWSNVTSYTHELYRGPEGSDYGDMQKLADINPSANGLAYVDGETQPLDNTQTYCYYVITRGSYGNPLINTYEPLENQSQILCTQPGDENPPCKPETPVAAKPLDCEAYVSDISTCNNNVFSNILKWPRPAEGECANDIAYYRIFVSNSPNGNFNPLPEPVYDTIFEDKNLASFARCYKIVAVDRSGNESEMSNAICFDTCPYYELPNVFTPNGDGCNEKFSAYSNREVSGEVSTGGQECITSEASKIKCARFVIRVEVKIYNRWGKEVYQYVAQNGSYGSQNGSGEELDNRNNIYVDWDGRAKDGSSLASGVYYYVANVTFDAIDPAKRNQTFKGWVHLLR
jgi:hypothetical protein